MNLSNEPTKEHRLDALLDPWCPPRRKALLPFGVFVAFYFGFALITRDFYKVPMTIAFLISSVTALMLNRQEKLQRKIELFALGMGHQDIMIMCLIFILAGAFTEIAKAVGGVDASVTIARALIPDVFLLPGTFMVACFISLAMGTSCGTIATLVPIGISLATTLGLNPAVIIGAIVGGSMFGDNLSLVSDTTIAATRSQGVEMRDKMLCNIKIVWAPALLCVLLYALPMFAAPRVASGEIAVTLTDGIKVMPYVLLLILGVAGVNVLLLLFFGIALNIGIGLWYQSFNIFDAFSIIGNGTVEMAPTLIVALLSGGVMALIRYNGGIAYLIQSAGRLINNRYTCELGICCLTGIINLFTANNTIAILTAGPLAKELGLCYKVDPKRIASLMDITSCVVQGMLPYGAQVLIATSLSTTVHLSAVDIMRCEFYPLLMVIGLALSMGIQKRRCAKTQQA